MDIPFARWYPAITKRKSRRKFDPDQPIRAETLARIDRVCKEFTPFAHARSYMVTESVDRVFKGIVGNYGKIQDAPALVAFVGDMNSDHVQEEVGYTGEGIILEATASGLDTCWVGGFFNPDIAASLTGIRNHERVLAVTPIGYARQFKSREEKLMLGIARSLKRQPLSRLISIPTSNETPEWIIRSLEAARLAPSAANRQPWGFKITDHSIEVRVRTRGPEFNVSKRLDCGIAMLHIEVAALNSGMRGTWELRNAPEVGHFIYSP